jgi:hypothetical protein
MIKLFLGFLILGIVVFYFLKKKKTNTTTTTTVNDCILEGKIENK